MFDEIFVKRIKKKKVNRTTNNAIKVIPMDDVIAGIALNDAKAGESVQIRMGKTVDEEKTELEKWFEIFDMEKKEDTALVFGGYAAGSAIIYNVSGGANI